LLSAYRTPIVWVGSKFQARNCDEKGGCHLVWFHFPNYSRKKIVYFFSCLSLSFFREYIGLRGVMPFGKHGWLLCTIHIWCWYEDDCATRLMWVLGLAAYFYARLQDYLKLHNISYFSKQYHCWWIYEHHTLYPRKQQELLLSNSFWRNDSSSHELLNWYPTKFS